MGLDKLKEYTAKMKNGSGFISEVADLVEEINGVQRDFDTYKQEVSSYVSAYTDFESKALALKDALQTAEDSLIDTEEEIQEEIYKDSEVQAKINDLKSSRDDYKKSLDDLKKIHSTIKNKCVSIFNSLKDLRSDYQDFEALFEDNESADTDVGDTCKQLTDASTSYTEEVAKGLMEVFEKDIIDNFEDDLTKVENELDLQKTDLDGLDQRLADKVITSDWTQQEIRRDYGNVDVSGIEEINEKFNSSLDGHEPPEGETQRETLEDLAGILDSLLGLQLFYDPNLDSVVSESVAPYNANPNVSSRVEASSLTSLAQYCKDLGSILFSNENIFVKIFKFLRSIVKFIEALAEFLAAIVAVFLDTLDKVFEKLADPQNWYNDLLQYGYALYTLPNRITYSNKSALTGYSFSKIYDAAGGRNLGSGVVGGLLQLGQVPEEGSDKMFKGAEAEYILVGMNNEAVNQQVAFFDLYALRFLLDLGAVLSDGEITAMAATIGPFGIILQILFAMIEPFIDSFLLVNGQTVPLVKSDVYMSPTGLTKLIPKVSGMITFKKILTDAKEKVDKASGQKTNSSGSTSSSTGLEIFNFSYQEHLLLLMILCVKEDTYWSRLKNIITMEAKNEDDDFRLEKAYTYVNVDVTYTLNPLFNLDVLTQSGLFTTRGKRYVGY